MKYTLLTTSFVALFTMSACVGSSTVRVEPASAQIPVEVPQTTVLFSHHLDPAAPPAGTLVATEDSDAPAVQQEHSVQHGRHKHVHRSAKPKHVEMPFRGGSNPE